jgi:LytS/YehU family sensor histidine kinase
LIWALLYFGVHFFENYERAEIQKWRLEAVIKDAELMALKSQLNPHFLFNALNSIRALIVEDPIRGQDAVTKLAGILRYSLQTSAAELSTLRAEMEFVEDYLSIEIIRFDERLAVDLQLSEAALDCAVPTMLVQTLVENGVKHGVAARPQGGTIKLRAWLEKERLRIQVENGGRINADLHSTKLGLQNATERLHLLFGAGAALTLTEGPNDQVIADLSLPAQTLNGTPTAKLGRRI